MRVLVVGSCRTAAHGQEAAKHPTPAQVEAQKAHADLLNLAADEIGGELARKGHVVVVGSDFPLDVDPHVVEGAVKQGAKRIEVHIPHGMPEPYRDSPHAASVETEWHQFPNWDVTVMEVIRDRVDAVIALGGRLGVVQAGLSAWMLDRPVIAIGSFGGGAKTIWEYSSGRRDRFYRGALSDAEIDRLAGPWGASGSGPKAPFVVDALERVSKSVNVARVPRGLLYMVMAVALSALACWVASITHPFYDAKSGVALIELFACVAFAGVLGTTLQTLRALRAGETVTDRKVGIDLALGLIAGVVSAALYMSAQVALSGKVELVLKQEDFVRVALVTSLLSLFSASYLDKAFARLDEASDRVIRGESAEAKAAQAAAPE